MSVLDVNNVAVKVGDFVRMIDSLPDHDVVRGVDYEVYAIDSPRTLRIRHTNSGKEFTGRAAYCFFKVVSSGGPW